MSDPSPPIRPFARAHVRAQTATEAAAFDRRAIDKVGVPEAVLMENAGRGAALVARALFLDASVKSTAARGAGAVARGAGAVSLGAVVALVGSGNNGGDALVALRSFAAWGYRVRAILVAERPIDDPRLHGWSIDVLDDENLDDATLAAELDSATLVLDGLLGTGVRGAPRSRQARVIEAVNRCSSPVVALDVPSGTDATTGRVPGAIVAADLTVSFGAPKVGALLHPARKNVGRHVTVEIGFPPLMDQDATAFVVTPWWAREHLPRRDTDTHKNRVGRVVVIGGGPGMAGAVILAGRSAFRAGAGLVQIATAAENRDAVHGALPEAIVVTWDEPDGLDAALAEANALVVGPGLGRGEMPRRLLRRIFETGDAPMVLDADALNLLAGAEAGAAADLPVGRAVLMTPHVGEMRRLMGVVDAKEHASPPPDLARRAAQRFDCAVLYKGAPSVVAVPDGPLAIDTQSSSDLAVAGMGDTLAGVCGALMAQGLAPTEAGALGLYLSGRAAALAGRGPGLTPSDVADALPDAVAELLPPSGSAPSVAPVPPPPLFGETDLDLPFVVFDADPAR